MIILILRASVQFFSLMLNRQIMDILSTSYLPTLAPAVCLYGLSLRFSFNSICIYTNGFPSVQFSSVYISALSVSFASKKLTIGRVYRPNTQERAMLRFVWRSQCISFAYLLNYYKVMKIITYLKELFMLSYYISISYLSDNLIQISDKCVKWSLVLIRLSLSIVDGYDGICVGES